MNAQTLDYRSLAKNFQGHKSGKHIAKVLLKNAHKKGALHGSNREKIKGYTDIVNQKGEITQWNLTYLT